MNKNDLLLKNYNKIDSFKNINNIKEEEEEEIFNINENIIKTENIEEKSITMLIEINEEINIHQKYQNFKIIENHLKNENEFEIIKEENDEINEFENIIYENDELLFYIGINGFLLEINQNNELKNKFKLPFLTLFGKFIIIKKRYNN
jgi:hypothetical protein